MSVGPYGPGGVLSRFEGGRGSPKPFLGKTQPVGHPKWKESRESDRREVRDSYYELQPSVLL